MKATSSTYSHPQPADCVDQQAGSSESPDRSRSTFNGREISNHQSCRQTATTVDERRSIEVAFWKKKPLQGRQITSAVVLNTYGNDITSLRSGFFLQKLCLRHMPYNNRIITPDQVVQEFNRQPDQNNEYKLAIARFKAECCLRGLPLNGQQVTPDEVYKDFLDSPGGTVEITLFNAKRYLKGQSLAGQQVNPDDSADGYAASASQRNASVAVRREPSLSDHQAPQLNALTLRTLDIMQKINDSYSNSTILITGSYARFLQNRCSSFNDIDIICTTEDSARTLFEELSALNQALYADRDLGALKTFHIFPIPGCQETKLSKAFYIYPDDSDSGMKSLALMAFFDDRVTNGDRVRLAIPVHGVDKPVWCLSFAEETRLLNDSLQHFIDNLNPLTIQLLQGTVFDIPGTILFNLPNNSKERIYGLLMQSLLTLHKARQFISLLSEGEHDYQLQEEQQRLHALAENLQTKL
ncbi:hypothetical protein, partial [Endozoicomonas sp. YOMI1]|uniref:hypothetical protein n=1 Tax=Endozoicomonas sp. YOMI1 TaxID=2828739 RepID=UPI0021496B3C